MRHFPVVKDNVKLYNRTTKQKKSVRWWTKRKL